MLSRLLNEQVATEVRFSLLLTEISRQTMQSAIFLQLLAKGLATSLRPVQSDRRPVSNQSPTLRLMMMMMMMMMMMCFF